MERPRDWPGAHVAQVLVQGNETAGLWFDRTQEYAARNRGETFDRLKYSTADSRWGLQLSRRELDDEKVKLYYDLVYNSLNEAARRTLEMMMKGYEYQSDFAEVRRAGT